MKKNDLQEIYWSNRYKSNETGWDIGYPSYPIKAYIDQLENTNKKILIPGCGNAYEAEYAFHLGFKNLFIADISRIPLINFKKRVPDFPQSHLIHSDFFKIDGTYDLIIEQTFFCALNPKLRKKYVEKMHSILNPGGKIVGLLFNFKLSDIGPPYGGDKKSYKNYFKDKFHIKTLELSYLSVPERKDKELFFIFEKK